MSSAEIRCANLRYLNLIYVDSLRSTTLINTYMSTVPDRLFMLLSISTVLDRLTKINFRLDEYSQSLSRNIFSDKEHRLKISLFCTKHK